MDGSRGPRLGPGAEFDRIRSMTFAADAPCDDRVRIGPGDDAAVLQPPAGSSLLVSCDMSVEDVHFRRAWLTWEEIGWRSVASALSDLAAMGGEPLGALLAVALAPELGSEVADALAGGAGNCLRRFDCPLVGGDLSRSPGPAVIDVTVLGSTTSPISRAGARPGDELWVTGELGAAALAAASWERGLEPEPSVRLRFVHPQPRLPEIDWLRARIEIQAAIDLSDGLAGDARHMAVASNARLLIEAGEVPLHATLQGFSDRDFALRVALTGGEDYELLLALAPGAGVEIRREFESRFDIPLTRVGRVESGSGVDLVDPDGGDLKLPFGGFDHFASHGS
jgi:thiamine-monophosphate kinase